jgi:hypothetical protein
LSSKMKIKARDALHELFTDGINNLTLSNFEL